MFIVNDVTMLPDEMLPLATNPITQTYTIGATDPDPLQNTFSGTATVVVPDPQDPGQYLRIPIEAHTIVTVDLQDAKLAIEKSVWSPTGGEITPTNGMVTVYIDQSFQYCFDVTNLNTVGVGPIEGIVLDDPSLLNFGITAQNLQAYFTSAVALAYPGHANDMLLGRETVHVCTPELFPTGQLPDPMTNTVTIKGRTPVAPAGTYDVVATGKAVIDFKGRDIEISSLSRRTSRSPGIR